MFVRHPFLLHLAAVYLFSLFYNLQVVPGYPLTSNAWKLITWYFYQPCFLFFYFHNFVGCAVDHFAFFFITIENEDIFICLLTIWTSFLWSTSSGLFFSIRLSVFYWLVWRSSLYILHTNSVGSLCWRYFFPTSDLPFCSLTGAID